MLVVLVETRKAFPELPLARTVSLIWTSLGSVASVAGSGVILTRLVTAVAYPASLAEARADTYCEISRSNLLW